MLDEREELELGPYPHEDRDTLLRRSIGDVLNEIKSHLTREELLSISIFKNSKRQSNSIHKKFLQEYYGKELATSTITMRKNRMFQVLFHVNNLLKFKKEKNADLEIKKYLTNHQYQILSLYESRKLLKEITALMNIKKRAITRCWKRILRRLESADNEVVKQYLVLLRNVLKFSDKAKFASDKNNC
jgi:hypothetical protein